MPEQRKWVILFEPDAGQTMRIARITAATAEEAWASLLRTWPHASSLDIKEDLAQSRGGTNPPKQAVD
jgi:hypothetical protein